MKFTGRVVRVSNQGKIKLPVSLLKKIGFDAKKDELQFSQFNESIIIQKITRVCFVTEMPSENLDEILPGLFISKEGRKLLLKEILQKTKKGETE